MVAIDRPRFKQELVAEMLEDASGRYVDLMDLDSGKVFRFYEVEYALACAMDGERDVAGIVRWAQEELGVTPSATEVQSVISQLGQLGYLDTRPPQDVVKPIETAPTQPAATKGPANVGPKGDDDLARGIVVGKQAPVQHAPVEDFELGASGGAAPTKHETLPAAPELSLGASGASAAAARRPEPAAVEDISLGASGSSGVPAKSTDLSTDLSSDFSLGANDVKEAVRASKVMTAVEVPAELLAEMDKPAAKADGGKKGKSSEAPTEKLPDPKQVAAAAAKRDADEKTAKAAADKAAADKVAADKKAAEAKAAADKAAADKKAADKAANDAKAKAGDAKKVDDKKDAGKKPATAVAVANDEKKPVTAPPAPKSGVSPALIVLLVLAVVGAGVFLVWKYVLDKPASEPTAETQPKPVAPTPPPPPPAPASKLALDTPAPADVKAGVAGTLESIEADKVVKAGDVIAKLTGSAPVVAAMDPIKKDLDKATTAIDAATKEMTDAKDEAARTAAQAKLDALKKTVDAKKQALDAKQADLDKLVVKAPIDGKLTAVAKKDAKVVETDVVAKVQADPTLGATFTAPGGKYAKGSPATVDLKDGKKLTCTVADVQGDQVKVTCAADASIPPNADITLE